jgi:hypothetical protein
MIKMERSLFYRPVGVEKSSAKLEELWNGGRVQAL